MILQSTRIQEKRVSIHLFPLALICGMVVACKLVPVERVPADQDSKPASDDSEPGGSLEATSGGENAKPGGSSVSASTSKDAASKGAETEGDGNSAGTMQTKSEGMTSSSTKDVESKGGETGGDGVGSTKTKPEGKTTSGQETTATTKPKETTTTSTQPEETTTPEADPTCEDKRGACVPKPPRGWSQLFTGKSSVSSSTPPGCTAPFSTSRGIRFTDFHEGRAKCDCECIPDRSTFRCQQKVPGGNIIPHKKSDCSDPSSLSFDRTSFVCRGEPGPVITMEGYVKAIPRPIESGSKCDPREKLVEMQRPYWRKSMRACEYVQPFELSGLCESSEICVPRNFQSRLCIYREGNHSCGSAWPYKTLYYPNDIVDDRSCKGCVCGVGKGQCNDRFWFGGCSNSPQSKIKPGDCVSTASRDTTLWETRLAPVDDVIDARCTSRPGNLTGTARPKSPTTVCCASQL